MESKDNTKVIARNKKAAHEYFIDETFECGIELFGTEVKSIRLGKVNLSDAYAEIDNGEIFVEHMNISPFEQGNIFNRDPLRKKKLLMHKKEILRLAGFVKEKGCTLIPLSVYLKGSHVKVSLALARGKRLWDKRQDIAKRDAKRDSERALRERNKL